ncbi:MAG: aminotransferase class V-fold PLP-dependent enzyme [Cyclobacteriaceae bacterium]
MSNQVFFTPGPSQKFYSLEQHLKNALREDIISISHRSADFKRIFEETTENLKLLLNIPSEYQLFFTSSATEIWERIVQNLVYSRSHHLVNGSFSNRFYETALAYQLQPSIAKSEFGQPLALTIPADTELIAITQNETSIGYNFPQEEIREIAESKPADALIAVDAVSCTPSVPLDYSLIDTTYFSVQKCFGLPAGLGVWIVNERCIEKSEKVRESGKVTGFHHSIAQLKKYADKFQTPETPNVLGIYLLNKVVQDLLYRGARQIQNDCTYKSAIIYQAMTKLDWVAPFISENKYRSKTVCVGQLVGRSSADIIDGMKKHMMILGTGYGQFKDDHIRIANFPTHSKEQMELFVDLLETI